MQPRCRQCRYTLTGLPAGLCPECGTPFNPNDPTTLYTRTCFLNQLATFTPASALTWVVGIVLGAFLLLTCSPNGALSDAAAACERYLFWPLATIWVIAASVHLIARRCTRVQPPRVSRRWIAVLVVLTVGLILRETNAVWNARWYLSKSSFDAALKNPTTTGWIGCFYVTEVQQNPDGLIRFSLGFPDTCYSQGAPGIFFTPGPMQPQNTSIGFYVGPGFVSLGDHWSVDFNPS